MAKYEVIVARRTVKFDRVALIVEANTFATAESVALDRAKHDKLTWTVVEYANMAPEGGVYVESCRRPPITKR